MGSGPGPTLWSWSEGRCRWAGGGPSAAGTGRARTGKQAVPPCDNGAQHRALESPSRKWAPWFSQGSFQAPSRQAAGDLGFHLDGARAVGRGAGEAADAWLPPRRPFWVSPAVESWSVSPWSQRAPACSPQLTQCRPDTGALRALGRTMPGAPAWLMPGKRPTVSASSGTSRVPGQQHEQRPSGRGPLCRPRTTGPPGAGSRGRGAGRPALGVSEGLPFGQGTEPVNTGSTSVTPSGEETRADPGS